jgi:hypothetical protein
VRSFQEEAPAPASTAEVMVLAWPYTDLKPAKSALPLKAVITPREGALYRNDFDASAAPLYYVYEARPLPEPRLQPVAEFEDGSVLQLAGVVTSATGLRVRLVWSASGPPPADAHAFVHLRNGNTIVAQDDGPLGTALYPPGDWRPGDWVETFHGLQAQIEPGLRLLVGLYHYPSGERIRVKPGAGEEVEVALP